jgi:hypothetical protein
VTASANLVVVRSIYATWERGDYTLTEWVHPEIEFVIADGPQPGRWIGVAGMAEGWSGLLSAWEDWRTWADEYRELDDERYSSSPTTAGAARRVDLSSQRYTHRVEPVCRTSVTAK